MSEQASRFLVRIGKFKNLQEEIPGVMAGPRAHRQILPGDKAPVLGSTVLEEALELGVSVGGPGLSLRGHGGILTVRRLSHLPAAAGCQLPAFSGRPLPFLHDAADLGTEEERVMSH